MFSSLTLAKPCLLSCELVSVAPAMCGHLSQATNRCSQTDRTPHSEPTQPDTLSRVAELAYDDAVTCSTDEPRLTRARGSERLRLPAAPPSVTVTAPRASRDLASWPLLLMRRS